jgi:hypothetical protein
MTKHTRATVPIELDVLRSDIAHILAATVARAEELETTGRTIFDAVVETARTDPADELRDRAARLHAGARYALTLAVEIESLVGRLEGIALARRIIESEAEAGALAPEAPRTRPTRSRTEAE